eukprot:evm.model.scf_1302.8 EVM.evm.TU.scf_1302.8   scf_1302:39632-42356(+)
MARERYFGLQDRRLVFSYATPEALRAARMEGREAAARNGADRAVPSCKPFEGNRAAKAKKQRPISGRFSRVAGDKGQLSCLVVPPEVDKSGEADASTSTLVFHGNRRTMDSPRQPFRDPEGVVVNYEVSGELDSKAPCHAPPSPTGAATRKANRKSTRQGGGDLGKNLEEYSRQQVPCFMPVVCREPQDVPAGAFCYNDEQGFEICRVELQKLKSGFVETQGSKTQERSQDKVEDEARGNTKGRRCPKVIGKASRALARTSSTLS